MTRASLNPANWDWVHTAHNELDAEAEQPAPAKFTCEPIGLGGVEEPPSPATIVWLGLAAGATLAFALYGAVRAGADAMRWMLGVM